MKTVLVAAALGMKFDGIVSLKVFFMGLDPRRHLFELLANVQSKTKNQNRPQGRF